MENKERYIIINEGTRDEELYIIANDELNEKIYEIEEYVEKRKCFIKKHIVEILEQIDKLYEDIKHEGDEKNNRTIEFMRIVDSMRFIDNIYFLYDLQTNKSFISSYLKKNYLAKELLINSKLKYKDYGINNTEIIERYPKTRLTVKLREIFSIVGKMTNRLYEEIEDVNTVIRHSFNKLKIDKDNIHNHIISTLLDCQIKNFKFTLNNKYDIQ